jgi:hypothetical protein
MNTISGFIAYSSTPGQVGESIESATRHYKNIKSWRHSEAAGQLIREQVLADIESRTYFLGEISVLNPFGLHSPPLAA